VIHPHPAIQPGTTLPTIGGTPATPAVEKTAPLPKGPEKIEEGPKEPKKLPSETSRGFQPASGTQVESGGRLPF
jgi:hypothetical protein